MFVGKIKILYTYNKYNRSLKPSNLPVNMEYRTVLLRPELFYNKITFKGGMFLLEKKKKKEQNVYRHIESSPSHKQYSIQMNNQGGNIFDNKAFI